MQTKHEILIADLCQAATAEAAQTEVDLESMYGPMENSQTLDLLDACYAKMLADGFMADKS